MEERTSDATTEASEIQSEEDRSNATVMTSRKLTSQRSRLTKNSTREEKPLERRRRD